MNSLVINHFPALGYGVNEAVNTLCTNLSFSGADVKRIMLTSNRASEGKSYLAMNIMRTMARFGKAVVLVDADLRRSAINTEYDVKFSDPERSLGLAHYLAGQAEAEDVLYQTNVAGAYMVPVGRELSNPLPLLNSERFEQLLAFLAQQADYVLVDAPPVGAVIDAAQIAKSCDGTLVVVNYNTVRRQELLQIKGQLEQTGCPILGTVLNMVEYDSYLSKKYYYKSHSDHYDYYAKSAQQGRRKSGKDGRA